MSDPYGFMRYAREEPEKQHVGERLRHWREYVPVMPDGQVRQQADRCIDCGTPWCHRHCPVHNLIPDWNGLASEQHWREAWEQLDSTNNFPEFTGRLCPAPCEDACTLRLSSKPVCIKSIELAIVEHAWRRGWIKPRYGKQKNFKRIAIIGSGPAGLACAQQLARSGYRVTVYEKADRIGGLLRYGIPDFRLEKHLLDRRLWQLEAEGVAFQTRTRIDSRAALCELRRSVHAVILACGAELPRDVRVPGRNLEGIHFAMDYLSRQNRYVAGLAGPDHRITAAGKDVVVIGGGDTGADCVGTAIRQGATSITQVQYHDQPPENPDILHYWPAPVPALPSNDHNEEGCTYRWGLETIAFEGEAGGLRGVRLQYLKWIADGAGKMTKLRLPDQTTLIPARLALLAIGYAHPVHEGLVTEMDLALDEHGNTAANDADYHTNITGVFSCGDMRRGQSLVVWAIREGRQCARAVDLWLSGRSDLPRV